MFAISCKNLFISVLPSGYHRGVYSRNYLVMSLTTSQAVEFWIPFKIIWDWVSGARMDCPELCWGRFRLDIRKDLCSEKRSGRGTGWQGSVESPSLTKCRDVALRTRFGGEQWLDWMIWEVFFNLKGSMILFLNADPIPKPSNNYPSFSTSMFLTPEEALPSPSLTEEPIPRDYFFPFWALFSLNPLPVHSMALEWHIWTMQLLWGKSLWKIGSPETEMLQGGNHRTWSFIPFIPALFHRLRMGMSFAKQRNSRVFWEESRESTELIPETAEPISPAEWHQWCL